MDLSYVAILILDDVKAVRKQLMEQTESLPLSSVALEEGEPLLEYLYRQSKVNSTYWVEKSKVGGGVPFSKEVNPAAGGGGASPGRGDGGGSDFDEAAAGRLGRAAARLACALLLAALVTCHRLRPHGGDRMRALPYRQLLSVALLAIAALTIARLAPVAAH